MKERYSRQKTLSQFSTNVSLLYPLKTENHRFSDVFRGIEVEH